MIDEFLLPDVDRPGRYVPLRRPCDDPEAVFAANRGKWGGAKKAAIKQSLMPPKAGANLHVHFAANKNMSKKNPLRWRKCREPGCETMVWKGRYFFCAAHRKPKA